MKRGLIFLTILSIWSCETNSNSRSLTFPNVIQKIDFKKIPVTYPDIKKDETIDDYHGTAIQDPYRWLEDDNSKETSDWVTNQNKVTFNYLDQIPYRKAIKNRLKDVWNFERFGTPFKEGGKYYYFKNDGLQNQAVLYEQETLDSPSKIALDPNSFSDDGTTSLGSLSFNKTGDLLAYQISEGGSDWRTIHVKDLNTGETLEDKVNWVKFSAISWFKDGFFYSRYPEPEEGKELSAKNEFHQVYFHKIGTDQAEDILTYSDRANPLQNVYTSTTQDERYLILSVVQSTSGNALYFKDLNKPNAEFIPIWQSFDNDFSVADNDGNNLLVMTNYQAPNNRIISIDTENPEEENWKVVIKESKNDALQGIKIIGGKIIATYIHNASSKVQLHNLDGVYESDLKLPGIGTVGGFNGKKEDNQAFFSFTSFTRPTTVFSLDMPANKIAVFKAPKIDFKSDDYTTEQVWFKSYDGTKVPMFLTYKKGLKLDGKRPTLLYGYGGFDIPVLPSFRVSNTVLLENGGIYAVANIRGGGEFGKKWHKAGTLENKQNVFNDFISAAEYLIAHNYTTQKKLAIQGGSNGGLLVGACMTQRPDLFQVAFPQVGVLDMLRYHTFTIGWAWATDYGRSDDPEAFKYLIKYSPLHNLKETEYPATMVTTADHDDRVVPAHSFKFISELQNKHQGDNPVLIRVETSAGHGAGVPTDKQIQTAADMSSFMFYNMKEDVIYNFKN
ncbi:prolyl oligopeptidase family serine peptidase [Saprospiraceae bacterium]|nr:prolyl oligopeptidase family serine peptidase [Saprospiraceae bacterium]MDB4539661.1 prolyl oligopeptidase family serine peptidase [Saprospiraceae bacterium]MDC3210214.1 prolyl oligopeptidase family serine peptidase [Saprospiraceae bacterium]